MVPYADNSVSNGLRKKLDIERSNASTCNCWQPCQTPPNLPQDLPSVLYKFPLQQSLHHHAMFLK